MNSVKIKRWLRKNNFDTNVRKDKYFCYSLADDCIFISDTFEECDHIDNFLKFIKQQGYRGNYKLKTLCFLHELGHEETMYSCTEFDYFIDKLKTIIETPCNNKIDLAIKTFIYFRLPVEIKATRWAIDYIKFNKNKVDELDELF